MVTNLDNRQLLTLMADEDDLQLLDVRTAEEHFYLGYIPHRPEPALIPIHELPLRIPDKIASGELDKAKKTVVVCEHGVRSLDAAHYLEHLGFADVYNLTHGMAEWTGPRNIPAQNESGNDSHADNQPNMAEWTGPRNIPAQNESGNDNHAFSTKGSQ